MFSSRNFQIGTLGAANATVEMVAKFMGATRLAFSAVGAAFSGTLVLELNLNGVWFPVEFYAMTATGTKLTSAALTNPSLLYGADLPPCSSIRVRCSAYTSGSVTVTLQNGDV